MSNRRANHGPVSVAVRRALGTAGASWLILSAALAAGTATAQEQVEDAASAESAQSAESAGSPESDVLGQVTVTGTRIVRDGYEQPTPVTVIGVEQLQEAPSQHISDFVNRLPAFAGAMSTTSGGNEISTGRQSQNNLNLRGLDVMRTLVLLDGHRIVSGDVNGAVNINDLPQSLIERVDVITGGASAAYGSDALAGVVNFVLDKDFEGFKTDLQSGITTHGDNFNYKASVTAGTAFGPDQRGHFIVSGEYARNDGIFGAAGSRDWGFDTAHLLANPAYGTGLGQSLTVPQFLVRAQAGTLLAAPGGLITSGPLRGTMFNQDGSPTQYRYGSLSNGQYNVGGDWELSDATASGQSLANRLQRHNVFARVSFDITDNVTAFANFIHSDSTGVARSKLDDTLAGITIARDNPYLDPSVAARMAELGLNSFVMGSFNLDLEHIYTNNRRRMFSYAAGLEGNFDALGSNWKWEAFGQIGKAQSDINARVMNRVNYRLAVDSVRNANGQIVCRVNADASTANDVPACVPWNPFGWGNNGASAIGFSKGLSTLDQQTQQTVGTVGISGDPFDSWAGQVSVAAGIEWRKEEVVGIPDALSLQSVYSAGNFKGIRGDYTVTEAYFETVVPLAKDVAWARALDFNAAVRGTDYSTSGYVTTWKAGVTYNPIDDLRVRVTRSRDIRAPNLGELFAAGTGGQSPGVLDPWNNNAPLPTFLNQTTGNPNLKPEKADTTGIGVVYQPSYLGGFSLAVDVYDIDVNGAIDTVGTQDTLNRCFLGQQFYCNNIARDANGQIFNVNSLPFNLSNLHQRGVDIETSYTTSLDTFVSSWVGEIDLRALGTHVMFSETDDGVNRVLDFAGDNSGSGPLNWRWMFSAGYSLDPVKVTWTGRFMSSGHYAPKYIECTANCPVSTPTATTIEHNYVPSRFYQDLSLAYEFEFGAGTSAQAFVNIVNLMDKQPPSIGNATYALMSTNPVLYDTIGRAFYAGIRIKM